MMVDQRIQKSSQNTPAQGTSRLFAPRPFAVQAQQDSHTPPTLEEIENDAFHQRKFEAFGLQLKHKNGTITPVEQKRLGVLQTQMDDFWTQRLPTASQFSSNFANIPVHTPGRPGSAPVQSQPVIQVYQAGVSLQSVQPAIAPAQTGEMGGIQRATLPAVPPHYSMLPLQAKLTVGQPNDRYEQEADRIAAQVVNQINTPPSSHISSDSFSEALDFACATRTQNPGLQKNCSEYSSQQDETIQRQEVDEEDDDTLQMKPLLQLQTQSPGAGVAATPELEREIGRSRSGGHPLSDNIRTPMEQAFGADFSRVKVHTDNQADQMNRSIQARAFTTGQDVFFRQGAYQPESRGGQELIAHELTHVVQQKDGAVRIGRTNQTQFLPLLFHEQSGKLIQRLTLSGKASKNHISLALNRLSEEVEKAEIEKCYSWAADLNSFEVFTAKLDAFQVYLSLQQYAVSSEQIVAEAGDNTDKILETAESILAFKTQKSRGAGSSKQEKKGGGKAPAKTKVGKVPDVLSLENILPPPAQAEPRPAPGDTLAELAVIDRSKYPATFASTMIAIHKRGVEGTLTIGAPQLLNGGKGTSKETVEVKVTLGSYSFVVHYHPKAEIPEGALSGESNIHLKGDRRVKHHETVSESLLSEVGIPTLKAIQDMDLK